MKRSRWAGWGLAALLGAAAWGGWTLWRAHGELALSRGRVDAAARLAVERTRVAPPELGFEVIPATPQYSDGAVFAGDLWLVGAAGVFRYGSGGELSRAWLVGRDLPPAPATRAAAGLDPKTQKQALFVATAGAGLLVFDERGGVEQVLPAEPELRNLSDLLPRAGGEVILGARHGGVASYSGGGLRRLDEELDEPAVTALAGDEGDLWVGTLDQGLLRWTGGRLERWGTAELLPDRQILSLASADGAVFAGTPTGVAELRDGAVSRILADGFFAQALLADQDRLALGSLDEGVAEIPLAAGRRPSGSAAGPDGAVRLLRFGSALLAVTPQGVQSREPGGDWTPLIEPPAAALTARNITALHAAGDGRLWVGYFDRGLDILAPGGSVEHHESDRIFCVNRIVEDREADRVAVATANGLTFFAPSGQPKETLTRDDGLISDAVSDVVVRPGGLAVATAAGVTFLEPGGPRSLYAFQGLVNNHVYALAARGPLLLAGTLGGLSLIQGGAVRAGYTTANSALRHNWINAVVEFRGDWYVGTYGAGVARLSDAGAWTLFPDMDQVEINPGALAVGADKLYAGTLDRGLLVYEPAMERWRSVTQGLPSLNVTALEAAEGTLWIGTENGLVKLAEEALSWP
ncbi:MAG: hypothetical protein GC160_14890 [Acidobacteria bacterium]|nr:hypothetical protein [Acidobacteriota bacterium]